MNLKQMLAGFVLKSRESALLGQVFLEHSSLSRLAHINFKQAVEARGMEFSEALMREARAAAMLDRAQTIGGFLDQRLKKKKPSRLTWGGR